MLKLVRDEWSPDWTKYSKDAPVRSRGERFNLFGFLFPCYEGISTLDAAILATPMALAKAKKEDVEFLTKGTKHTLAAQEIFNLILSGESLEEKKKGLKEILEKHNINIKVKT